MAFEAPKGAHINICMPFYFKCWSKLSRGHHNNCNYVLPGSFWRKKAKYRCYLREFYSFLFEPSNHRKGGYCYTAVLFTSVQCPMIRVSMCSKSNTLNNISVLIRSTLSWYINLYFQNWLCCILLENIWAWPFYTQCFTLGKVW